LFRFDYYCKKSPVEPAEEMKESTSKEKVLKNIRDALVNSMPPPYESVDLESSIFADPKEDFPEVAFAEAFSNANGNFIYCSDFDELLQNLKALLAANNLDQLYCGEEFLISLLNDFQIPGINYCEKLQDAQAAVTACEVLVSRTGSIVMSSNQGCGRKGFSVPPVHIIIASTRQLVYNIKDAFMFLNKKYKSRLPSMITFITGPSRTADIEKKLVHGVHGPKEIYLFLVENR
jgi:L-lactate dehydrogenase complex protein LldG